MRGTIPTGKKKAMVNMVNVWVDELGLSFGQQQVESKSNEIDAIPKLLDQVDCQGSIITIDAIACQKNIVKKIIDKQADYLIALKANQKGLYEEVVDFMEKRLASLPSNEKIDLGHGRGEKRKVYSCSELNLVYDLKDWVRVRSLVMIERERHLMNGKVETSRQYFMSSLENSTTSAEKFNQYLRGHWGIENCLHRQAFLWQLDFTFKEDHSKVRTDMGPANLHLIRKWALHLLKKDPAKISMKRKRKKAGRSINYLLNLIT